MSQHRTSQQLLALADEASLGQEAALYSAAAQFAIAEAITALVDVMRDVIEADEKAAKAKEVQQ